MSWRKQAILLTLPTVISCAICIYLLRQNVTTIYYAYTSKNWPTSTAHIFSRESKRIKSGSSWYIELNRTYTFKVEENLFSGATVAFGLPKQLTQEQADVVSQLLLRTDYHPVSYDPVNPERNVLIAGTDYLSTWFWLETIVIALALLAAIFGCIWLIRKQKRRQYQFRYTSSGSRHLDNVTGTNTSSKDTAEKAEKNKTLASGAVALEYILLIAGLGIFSLAIMKFLGEGVLQQRDNLLKARSDNSWQRVAQAFQVMTANQLNK